jgi:ribosomal protein S18 acetylase RimI-like enzyme
MEIKYFNKKTMDLKDLSDLFIEILPNDILSCLGKKFIERAYFYEFIKSPKNTIIFAKDNFKIVGFILACDSLSFFKRVLLNHKILFIKSIVNYIFNSPNKAIKHIASIIKFSLNERCNYKPANGVELCYIAISPSYQKKGIGSALIDKLFNFFMKDKVTKEIYVKTLTGQKERAASDFYLKNNFKIVFECEGRFFLNRLLK